MVEVGLQSSWLLSATSRAILITSSWFVHLEDQVAVLGVHLTRVERRAVVIEAPTIALDPSGAVERIKVVLPVEIKRTRPRIVLLHFYVVVLRVPRHVPVVEVVAPTRERWRPEVHHQVLGLILPRDGACVCSAAHLSPIDKPGNVAWCPLEGVLVEIGARLEVRL